MQPITRGIVQILPRSRLISSAPQTLLRSFQSIVNSSLQPSHGQLQSMQMAAHRPLHQRSRLFSTYKTGKESSASEEKTPSTGELSRQQSSEFLAFKQRSKEAVEKNPSLLRLDCLNPTKAIKHSFDCSDSPEIDPLEAWQQFLGFTIPSYIYSSGVRHSLKQIFSLLKQDGQALTLPADVYPVYQMMARDAGLKYETYSTIASFDIETSFRTNCVLLTAPLMPLGRDLTTDEVRKLILWLKNNTQRQVIIDRVYDYTCNNIVQELISQCPEQVTVCYSLAKTLLSPGEMGLTLVPASIRSRLTSMPHTFDKAKSLLMRHKNFAREQQSIFRYRWGHILPAISDIDESWQPPQIGYLSVVKATHQALIERGILAIPGEVYGASNAFSIISCLHETNRHGDCDLVTRRHVTVLSNFSRGYDKYSRTYSKKGIPESTYPKRFFLLDQDLREGFRKAQKLLLKTDGFDKPVILETRLKRHELHKSPSGIGEYVERDHIDITDVYTPDERTRYLLRNNDVDEKALAKFKISVEEAYAGSLSLNKLYKWSELKPRSLSALPVAKACQAKCAFCFSHSSISDDQRQGRKLLEKLESACAKSAALGAERLVITGGGEPTMLDHKRLLEIIAIGKKHFDKIVMITNGYSLGRNTDRQHLLNDYVKAGLSVLSISRHSHDKNEAIMKLNTHSELIAHDVKKYGIPLPIRWVCVLQKGGVDNETTLKDYLNWVVETGAKEICFKELYVSVSEESQYHTSTYNKWSQEHQVPLKLIIDFLHHNNAKKVAELPWGSPVYTLLWKGQLLKIAAYTEPSVFWERTNGVCRSWNLMADGSCYANLETTTSLIPIAS